MKRADILSIALVVMFAAPPVRAGGNDFPGQGSLADWKRSQTEYDLAHKLKESGNIFAAIDHFKKAIAIYPYDDKYFFSRADCFRKMDEGLNAKIDCAKAIHLKNEPIYWIMIADISAEHGDFLTCKKAANTAIGAGDSGVAKLGTAMLNKWSRMAMARHTTLPDTTAKMLPSELGVASIAPPNSYFPPVVPPAVPRRTFRQQSPAEKMRANFSPPRRVIGRPADDSAATTEYIPPFLDKSRSR